MLFTMGALVETVLVNVLEPLIMNSGGLSVGWRS